MTSSAVALIGLVLGLMAAGIFSVQVRWGRPHTAPSATVVPSTHADDVLPLPRRGERALSRARLLAQTGRLRDSLASLDQIAMTDEERPVADRLRAEIQRQLIAAGSAVPGAHTVAESGPSAGRAP
jgi:hypothetical protein